MALEDLLKENTEVMREMIAALKEDIAVRRDGIEVVREAKDKAETVVAGKAAAATKETKPAAAPKETKAAEKPKETKAAAPATVDENGRPTYDHLADLLTSYVTGTDREEEAEAREAACIKWIRKASGKDDGTLKDVPETKYKALKGKIDELIAAGDITQPAEGTSEDEDI